MALPAYLFKMDPAQVLAGDDFTVAMRLAAATVVVAELKKARAGV